MKKSLFRRIFNLTWLVLAALLTFTACDDDDDNDDPTTIILDGYYVMGDATAITGIKTEGMMKATKNEVGQVDRPTLFEKYIALKANTDFSIKQVAGATQKTWGPGANFAEVTTTVTDEPTAATFWRGDLAETTTAFQVPEDGLYHVVIDSELQKVVVARVKWAIIGDATQNAWNDTYLDSNVFDLNNMSFSKENVRLLNGKIKFRYSGGWKIQFDDAGEVKVNTNFGESVTNLVPGGADIVWSQVGFYTVKIIWDLEDGTSAVLIKTGSVEPIDYSSIKYGIRGTGIMVADTAWSWGVDYMPHLPVIVGTDYTYEWNDVSLSKDGEFKIHGVENDQWLGVSGMTIEGDTDGILGGSDNFAPTVDTIVNLQFTIKAAEFSNTLTISPVAK